MSETWTIGRLLAFTADYLKQHGSDTPRLDTEVLLAAARGCQRIQLYTAFDEAADDRTRQTFREWVRRRAEGTPVAYLVGYREFYSLRFRVTPDVLIPRPETELLVVRLLDLAKGRPAGSGSERMGTGSEPATAGAKGESNREVPVPILSRAPTIIDVGTGSGIIAICAAKQLPQARITAIDISPAAIAVARANAVEHGVAERIEWITGDLLSRRAESAIRFHRQQSAVCECGGICQSAENASAISSRVGPVGRRARHGSASSGWCRKPPSDSPPAAGC